MSRINKKPIKIANLLLNVDNPRFDTTANQREAVGTIISELSKKMMVLIQSIIVDGLNPSELTMVTSTKKTGKYKVLEGNRRIAALKLIHNPNMFKDKYKSFTNGLKKILRNYHGNKINEVDCVIFTNEEEANRWIKLKHTGENNGKGVVSWDAQQVGRFDARVGGKESVGLQAINFLKNFDDKDINEKLQKTPITSFERLLTDRYIQSVLGLEINNGLLETNLVREEITKGLLKIVGDLASKKIKVKDIYTKDDRRNYVSSFKEKDVPNPRKLAENTWYLNSPYKRKSKPKKKAKPQPTERVYLIPPNCMLDVDETKANKIYRELRNLEVEKFKHAVSVLFRVFMELSVDKFVEKYRLPTIYQSSKDKKLSLRAKLKNVIEYMTSNGMATNSELKGARTVTQGTDNMFSMDTFNDYVHNRYFSPTIDALTTGWDNIQIFMQKLWENV